MILVPVSIGELIDKITILKIKLEKINDENKLKNVRKEYELLTDIMNKMNITENDNLFIKLYDLNLEFWNYHDWQREKWKNNTNDNMIDIELYKANKNEHILNDKRAEIKKNINLTYNSDIVEEKQFISYNI
jgi:hypothetical protein